MRTKVTPEDKKAFKRMTAKDKPTSFSLVYKVGGKVENIPGFIEKEYTLCQWKRNQLERYAQFQTGELIIKSNYDAK